MKKITLIILFLIVSASFVACNNAEKYITLEENTMFIQESDFSDETKEECHY